MAVAEPGPLCVAITGANRGLGRELAQQYAGQGARVLALSRRPPENVPKTVVWHRVDLSDASAIESMAAALSSQPIDILINNAAIRGATGGLSAVAAQDFARVMAVNALAPVLLTRALLPNLRAGSARVVAMISSRAGSLAEGLDPDGDYAYRASKAALNIATAKLADDLRDLAFLLLHPGWIRTDMGGAEAEMEPARAARGLVERIADARPGRPPRLQCWDGTPVAW